MAASTTALPPLTCTARGRPTSSAAVVFAARPANCGPFVSLRPEPGGESAGCVCLQCLVLRAVCLSILCLPCPLPFSTVAPAQFHLPQFILLLLAPVHCHVRQDHRLLGPAVCKLRELSRWQLQHGPAVAAHAPVHLLTVSFSCRVHDPGPWV